MRWSQRHGQVMAANSAGDCGCGMLWLCGKATQRMAAPHFATVKALSTAPLRSPVERVQPPKGPSPQQLECHVSFCRPSPSLLKTGTDTMIFSNRRNIMMLARLDMTSSQLRSSSTFGRTSVRLPVIFRCSSVTLQKMHGKT